MSLTVTQAMDTIVNSPSEDLVQVFNNMNQGELLSFKNQFTLVYEQQVQLKDKILEKLDKKEVTQEEVDKVLPNLYLYMQKLEDVVSIATEVINSRK